MESRTNQSVTPDVQALMLENLKLAKRVEVLENTLSAGKEVLTLEEAARFMGVTKSSLYKMTHEQTIPYYKPNGKMVYFEKAELLTWIRRNAIASKAQVSEEANRIHYLEKSKCQVAMRTTEYEAKKEQAVKLSVLWAKTGLRELSMRDAVNDYIEATGANHAIDNDEQAILYGRRAVALRVSIEAINSLNKDELQRLDRKLMEIVSEDMPRQQHGLHR